MQYINTHFGGCICHQGVFHKELMLPPSELYHLADLVCVMSCSGDVSGVSVMAVSPEGLVRYWPSIAHDSAAVDMETDLIGSQCHSITAFQVCYRHTIIEVFF